MLAVSEQYEQLVKQCKEAIGEGEFTARWALIESYHEVGRLILEYQDKYQKGNGEFIDRLSSDIGKSSRTIYYAIEFAQKYPELDQVPEGTAISWNKIKTKYLSSLHGVQTTCPTCGQVIKNDSNRKN